MQTFLPYPKDIYDALELEWKEPSLRGKKK